MKLSNRLRRLEQKVPDPGCLACRDRRGRIVLVEAERRADGSVVLRHKEPEACAECGIVPENIVRVVLSVGEARNLQDEPVKCNKERA